jgi:hypothetical protein
VSSFVRRHRLICAVAGGLVLFASGGATASLVLGHGHDRGGPVQGPTQTIVVHDGSSPTSAALSPPPAATAPPSVSPSSPNGALGTGLSRTQAQRPSPTPAAKPVRISPTPGHKPDLSAGPLPAPAATTPSPGSPATFTDEASAANALVSAWRNNDRSAAGAIATDDVVNALFADAWTENNRPLGCSRDVSGLVVCSYAEGTGSLGLYVAPTDTGFQVQGVGRSDPD